MIEIITEADYKDRLAATQNGVLLFFKKLCPHCKNMEKVLEKGGEVKASKVGLMNPREMAAFFEKA